MIQDCEVILLVVMIIPNYKINIHDIHLLPINILYTYPIRLITYSSFIFTLCMILQEIRSVYIKVTYTVGDCFQCFLTESKWCTCIVYSSKLTDNISDCCGSRSYIIHISGYQFVIGVQQYMTSDQ